MNIDVAKAVKELLYEHETVIVPGLGGFIGTPLAASVDYVQGAVSPPSKKIAFNTNLVVNDGLLVNHIQQGNLVTAQEAQTAIDAYVETIKEALDQREIVEIPELGRLYRDYEQNIRFMPEATNFEPESYGLPTVRFTPIVRQKTAEDISIRPEPVVPNYAPTPPPKPEYMERGWAEKTLPMLIAGAALLLAVTLFAFFRNNDTAQSLPPQDRTNVKPGLSEEEPIDEPIAGEEETAPAQNETDVPPANEEKEETTGNEVAEEPPTTNPTSPATNSGGGIFIVVHSFGSKENARKFARELQRAGYQQISKEQGGLTRVGVELPATQADETEALIQELGKKFKASPVVVDY